MPRSPETVLTAYLNSMFLKPQGALEKANSPGVCTTYKLWAVSIAPIVMECPRVHCGGRGKGKSLFSYFPQVWDCPHCPVTAFGTANMTKLTWRALACRLVDVMWKGKESSLCVGQGKIPRISGERLTQNNCSVCINTFEPLQHRKEKIFQTVGICLAFSIGSSFASQNMLI